MLSAANQDIVAIVESDIRVRPGELKLDAAAEQAAPVRRRGTGEGSRPTCGWQRQRPGGGASRLRHRLIDKTDFSLAPRIPAISSSTFVDSRGPPPGSLPYLPERTIEPRRGHEQPVMSRGIPRRGNRCGLIRDDHVCSSASTAAGGARPARGPQARPRPHGSGRGSGKPSRTPRTRGGDWLPGRVVATPRPVLDRARVHVQAHTCTSRQSCRRPTTIGSLRTRDACNPGADARPEAVGGRTRRDRGRESIVGLFWLARLRGQ